MLDNTRHFLLLEGKGEGRPVTCDWWHRGGSNAVALLMLNSGPRRGQIANATLRPLFLREEPGTNCTGGWVGPRAGLDGCGKDTVSYSRRGSNPKPSCPQRAALPTAPSRAPQSWKQFFFLQISAVTMARALGFVYPSARCNQYGISGKG